MERRALTFCGASAVALALLCCGHAFASEDAVSATQGAPSRPSAETHGRLAARSHKIAQPSKVKEKKAAAAKAQPWFDVDPGRAVLPPDPGKPATPAKPAAPPSQWAKDRFDFQSKVIGSNDFQLLPRFDINQNPQGLGGEMGVNLHF